MRYLGFFAAAAVALASCGGGGSSSVPSGSSTMNVALVDAPFATSGGVKVTAVNLGILKVEVVGNGAAPTAFVTNATSQIVNILNYTSASAPLPFSGPIPPGTYSQVRFLLDTKTTTINYTDANGAAQTSQLTIPSATTNGNGNNTSTDAGDGQGTAGVKVNVALTAVAGTTYGFVIDFNALHSIIVTGTGGPNPQFMMKPVLVATAQAISGSIAGTVKNQAGTVAVTGAEVDAVQDGTTVNSSVTADDGTFTINALPAGSYTLVVKNSYNLGGTTNNTAVGYDVSVGPTLSVSTSVTVTAGQTAQAGTSSD